MVETQLEGPLNSPFTINIQLSRGKLNYRPSRCLYVEKEEELYLPTFEKVHMYQLKIISPIKPS